MASAAVSARAMSSSALAEAPHNAQLSSSKPNVIIIMVDDQAYGDLSCMGNTKLQTPNIDRLRSEGAWFPNHYGCPLCSPARASMLTGRYNYRTGIVDTSTGLSMMRPDEITLADILSGHGYRTFVSTKWHLGDHYPLRPGERGFHESLVAKDAIVSGISNPPNNSLFNPILYHNNVPVKTEGYVTDLAFEAAARFIEAGKDRPFFVYLPTNVVHIPVEVPQRYSDPFKAAGLDDYTATLYGEMVNLDENIGRLRDKLKELGIADNTIIMYTVDNGPIGEHGVTNGPDGAHRFNLGLRGGKGSVWEGGIKLPFFVTWPSGVPAGTKSDAIVSHIDIMPTVLEMCNIPLPKDKRIDGKSLLPLMKTANAPWPGRTLFFQQSRPDTQHRVYSDQPRLFVMAAAREQKYKIVMISDSPGERDFAPASVEETKLYDIDDDPGEAKDISHEHPDIVSRMRSKYETWFNDVTQGVSPLVRNVVGSPHENPVKLSSQDLRGPRAARGPHRLEDARLQAQKNDPHSFGYWAVEVARAGAYKISMQFEPPTVLDDVCRWQFPLKKGEAFLRIGEIETSKLISPGTRSVIFNISLQTGKYFLDAVLTGQRLDNEPEVSPFFVNVELVHS